MRGGLLTGLPPLGPDALLRGRGKKVPYPLGEDGLTLFAWGRDALSAGLGSLGLGSGAQVLMPAYHHGSEVEATMRAGAECRFYAGTPRLEPDDAELEALLTPRVRALHLTHHLGFPQDCARWRRWCDERGLLLIEDAAQAWLGGEDGDRPIGSYGDISIFCLYKAVPLPDGAALVSRARPRGDPPAGAGGLAAAGRSVALWLAQRSDLLGRLVQRRLARGDFDPVAEVALTRAGAPSRATLALLPRLTYSRARLRRRRSYLRLLEALGDRVPPPFERLPESATPWLFPVTAEDKRGLLDHLGRRRIKAVDLWSVPHPSLDPDLAAALARRRATTVGLPIHQGLGDDDVDRIAAAAADWGGWAR